MKAVLLLFLMSLNFTTVAASSLKPHEDKMFINISRNILFFSETQKIAKESLDCTSHTIHLMDASDYNAVQNGFFLQSLFYFNIAKSMAGLFEYQKYTLLRYLKDLKMCRDDEKCRSDIYSQAQSVMDAGVHTSYATHIQNSYDRLNAYMVERSKKLNYQIYFECDVKVPLGMVGV